MEADEENMYYIANNFLLQRVLENSSNVDFWLDYAIFQLKNGYFEKSKESIKEALSLNIRHQTGLLMYAVLLVQTEEYRVAQVFFEALTMFYPDFTEGWVTFHLFFLKIENYVGADVTLAISKYIHKLCGRNYCYLPSASRSNTIYIIIIISTFFFCLAGRAEEKVQ
ncbi:hypothetical protein C0J52_15536 [Blattella germanica]|nr:hypothetical protein C0J52_15536 [Blattella germanica]